MGHNVVVITETPPRPYSNDKQSSSSSATSMGEADGIKIIRINPGKDNWFKKFRVWSQLLTHRGIIETADVVHCHDVFYWYLPFKLLFPFKKVFTTFHGYEGNSIPGRKAVAMHKIAETLSNGNICVGNFYKKWYGTKPTFITYGAVDFLTIKKYKTENKNKNNSNNKIIFFVRLESETGIMKYVEALKILKEKGISLELDIYGEGSLKEAVKKYKEKNNLKINIKGFIVNIESVLNNYEYVFCSRYLSILESMAFDKPVFAVYNNGIKKDYLESAEFSSYIYISSTPQSLANEVEHLILNKDYKEKIEDGFKWAKTQTWDLMVNNYLRLWKI